MCRIKKSYVQCDFFFSIFSEEFIVSNVSQIAKLGLIKIYADCGEKN